MLEPLIAHWRERPPRTWSVVITIFGDAIQPRGGTVWLATLTALLAGLDIDAGGGADRDVPAGSRWGG